MERFICIEIHGDGDPFFGGKAEDRPLGANGQFLTARQSWSIKTATFPSREAALDAAKGATRRPDSLLSAFAAPWAAEQPNRYALA